VWNGIEDGGARNVMRSKHRIEADNSEASGLFKPLFPPGEDKVPASRLDEID
jgi:hypothetical protein